MLMLSGLIRGPRIYGMIDTISSPEDPNGTEPVQGYSVPTLQIHICGPQ